MDHDIIGFLDESSPQTTSNTVRMWSFRKPMRVKNTSKYRAITFGFHTINGESLVDFHDTSTKEDMCRFLEHVRKENPARNIVLILDKFASHRSSLVKAKSVELNTRLVFLPPYSPDLNPIEFLWKSIKRVISRSFVTTQVHLQNLVSKTFMEISAFNSYSLGWIRKFMPEEYNKYRKLGV